MTCDAGFCQRIERISYVLAGSDNVFDIVFLELLWNGTKGENKKKERCFKIEIEKREKRKETEDKMIKKGEREKKEKKKKKKKKENNFWWFQILSFL